MWLRFVCDLFIVGSKYTAFAHNDLAKQGPRETSSPPRKDGRHSGQPLQYETVSLRTKETAPKRFMRPTSGALALLSGNLADDKGLTEIFLHGTIRHLRGSWMIVLSASVTLSELLRKYGRGPGQDRYEQITETHYLT